MNTHTPETKIGHSIGEVAELTGLCRQTLYNEINNGALRSFKVGRRRLISPQALHDWVRSREQDTAA